MPPKNKKDAEDEAKRLEEQRKRKQEEEAMLELERKKYASEKLSTGLLLPASSQLIIDFPTKTLAFITEKLKNAIKEDYPELQQSSRLPFIMKELHYFIKDSVSFFGPINNPESAMPHRFLIGAMLSTLLHNDPTGNGKEKNRQADERHLKDLVLKHCHKTENPAYLTKSQGLKILQYAAESYFGKFNLLKMFENFKKRDVEVGFNLYIETPNAYFNDRETPFLDLSEKEKEGEEKKEQVQ